MKTVLIVIVDNWGPQSAALWMVPVMRKVIMKVGPVIDLFLKAMPTDGFV